MIMPNHQFHTIAGQQHAAYQSIPAVTSDCQCLLHACQVQHRLSLQAAELRAQVAEANSARQQAEQQLQRSQQAQDSLNKDLVTGEQQVSWPPRPASSMDAGTTKQTWSQKGRASAL